jgi:hypothetical protein
MIAYLLAALLAFWPLGPGQPPSYAALDVSAPPAWPLAASNRPRRFAALRVWDFRSAALRALTIRRTSARQATQKESLRPATTKVA